MKILFDYSIFFHQKIGGISRYFLNLQKEFLKNNQNSVKILAPINKNILLKNYKNNNLLNFYLNNYPLFTKKLFKNINYYSSKAYCNIYKPDIIHNTFFEKKNLKKYKKVITVYDLIHEIYHKDYGKENNYRPKKKSLDNADHIICISNKTKEDLINIYNIEEKKINVVYLGVQKFNKIENQKIRINRPYILYVGGRSKYKNFDNLLKAYSMSKKLQKDFDIVCCGGDKFSEIEKKIIFDYKIDPSKIKQFNANDNELNYLYKNASLLVYPSLYEGFGLPTIEAMSLGCPVASSDHSAIIEAVGDAAKLFNPKDSEDIKISIENIVYSEEITNNLIKKGYERSNLFTWKKCSEKTMNIYKKIL